MSKQEAPRRTRRSFVRLSQSDPPGRGIRLAFAGAGHWHFNIDAQYLALAREAGCDIVALQDDDAAVAGSRAGDAGCPWTTDLTELVGRYQPDLVVAMPRPDRAPAQVAALLDLGVPLFAEKPLGTRADQVWPLVRPAERGWVTVAFPNRLLPIWEEAKRLDLGPVAHFNLRLLKGSPKRYVEFGVPWMLDENASGGGPVRNFGIHLADLVNRQLERWQNWPPPEVIGAVIRRLDPQAAIWHVSPYSWAGPDHPELLKSSVEEYGVAVLAKSGTAITLEVGYTLASPTASDMELRISAAGATLIQRRDALEIQAPAGAPRMIANDPNRTGYRGLFFDALRRFRRGTQPLAGVRECAMANEVVDAIYDIARWA